MSSEFNCDYCGDKIDEGQEVYNEDGEVFCCDECLFSWRDEK